MTVPLTGIVAIANVSASPSTSEPVSTIGSSPKNAGNISVRFRGGITTSWPPGAAVSFEAVDLSEIEVRGAPNYKVLVAAYAPGTHPRGRSALHLGTKYVVEQAEAIPNEGEGEIGIG